MNRDLERNSGPNAAGRRDGRWSPFLVGVGIGVLSWVVFAVVNQPLGISTPISVLSGVCAGPLIGSAEVAGNPYWIKHPFRLDYSMMFLVGTFLGSLASVLVGRSFRWEAVPTTWRRRFGPGVGKRLLAAFLGGIVIMYGARLAGGCTSGHGISGSLQLAVSSWVFFLTLFASGLLTAFLLFRRLPPHS